MVQNVTMVAGYPILNDGAPLRYVDPAIALEFQLGHYVIVGSMAVRRYMNFTSFFLNNFELKGHGLGLHHISPRRLPAAEEDKVHPYHWHFCCDAVSEVCLSWATSV